jgi:hypothetical protein
LVSFRAVLSQSNFVVPAKSHFQSLHREWPEFTETPFSSNNDSEVTVSGGITSVAGLHPEPDQSGYKSRGAGTPSQKHFFHVTFCQFSPTGHYNEAASESDPPG